jgi:hypothetical protein
MAHPIELRKENSGSLWRNWSLLSLVIGFYWGTLIVLMRLLRKKEVAEGVMCPPEVLGSL